MQQTDTVVDVADVRFAWPGSAAVALPPLRLARGERVFLRGPSGSGKSTLLNLLAGVLRAQAGSVRVLGHDLSQLPGAARDRFRADHIGIVFQLFNLIPYLSMVENVCLPCRFSALRRSRALRTSPDVASEARRLLGELDLPAPLQQRAVTALSVGQQQRVAAARALIGAPELLLADEPTSALDADRRAGFLDLLFRQCEREGTTLLFASHDGALAACFDRCVDLADHGVGRSGTEAAGLAAAA